MLIFPHCETVLITPPHTASRNLTAAVSAAAADLPGFYVVHGPVPDSLTVHDHHYGRLPPDHSSWRVACVVRHPLDRLIGLHRHWCSSVGFDHPEWPLHDWTAFAIAAAAGERGYLSWMYRWTITDLLRYHGHSPYSILPVQFETLTADLSELLGAELIIPPRFGWSHAEHFSHHYTPDLRAAVAEWAAPDLTAWYADEHFTRSRRTPETLPADPEPIAATDPLDSLD